MNRMARSRWLAPVKINLFLHINGQIRAGRYRGYHELQTYFQRLAYGDELLFERIDGPELTVTWQPGEESVAMQPARMAEDLVYRAAALLQQNAIERGLSCPGARIALIKNTPVGGGLGGGSSAAATTLLALNQLWAVNLSRPELIELAEQLGADVPFFLHQTNAWAEGIGDRLGCVAQQQGGLRREHDRMCQAARICRQIGGPAQRGGKSLEMRVEMRVAATSGIEFGHQGFKGARILAECAQHVEAHHIARALPD